MPGKYRIDTILFSLISTAGITACNPAANAEEVFSIEEPPHAMQRCYWLSREIPAEGLCGEKMRPDVRVLKEEAEKGNSIAAMRLGQLYGTGNWGVDQDLAQAIKWYERAASLGDRYSQIQLAQAYEFGRLGVEQDIEMAIKFYQQAAAGGIYPNLEAKIERLEAVAAASK